MMTSSGRDEPLRAALLGCGYIGSLADERAPGAAPRSHAEAYARRDDVELVALCDADSDRLAACAAARGVSDTYADFRTMLRETTPEVLSICTPVALRAEAFECAADNGVRRIFCEKPIADSAEELLRIGRASRDADMRVVVNYLRRWDPSMSELASDVSAGRLGRIQCVTIFYGKGLLNNGSHALDLVCFALGEPAGGRATRVLADGREGLDATLDADLEFRNERGTFPVRLLATDHREHSLFEIDVIGTRGRARLLDGGARVQHYDWREDTSGFGYHGLAPGECAETGISHALALALDDLLDPRHDAPSRCGLAEAARTAELVWALRSSPDTNGPDVGSAPTEHHP